RAQPEDVDVGADQRREDEREAHRALESGAAAARSVAAARHGGAVLRLSRPVGGRYFCSAPRSISSACARAFVVIFAPPIMRAISSLRASASSRRTTVCTRPLTVA